MEYAIWAYLKRRLNKTETKTTEWMKMDQSCIDKVLVSWPKRVFKIYKTYSFHIRHRLKL